MSNTTAPKMTKQHFIYIATILGRAKGYTESWLDMAEEVANELARTNPSFDRERFLAAVRSW